MDLVAEVLGLEILLHVLGHQMAPVRRRIDQHVVRGRRDRAVEHRLERGVARLVGREGQIVAEQNEAQRLCGDVIDDVGQIHQILLVHLDQAQALGLRTRSAPPSPATICRCRARPSAARCWPAVHARTAACSARPGSSGDRRRAGPADGSDADAATGWNTAAAVVPAPAKRLERGEVGRRVSGGSSRSTRSISACARCRNLVSSSIRSVIVRDSSIWRDAVRTT